MIGRTLDGFRIVGLLGRGGMGEVWKAEQVALGDRPVALKLLRADRADLAQALQRLQREGILGGKLKHPGIAQVITAGETQGQHYVAMEFVEGESLARRLERGALAPAEARRVALAVADALAHAHDRGVLHRDVTPNNVMLEPGGRVVLLDFGLALAMGQSRVTSDGVVLGTAHYIAPEVLRRFDPDARSDVYALGVVFYHALAGGPPFAGERREQVEYAALHVPPDPPSRRCAALSGRWDAVALRAIAREPGLRFQSAREFATALEGLEAPQAADAVGSTETTGALPSQARLPAPRQLRIAVMPFTDMGGTPEGAAFADGLAESVGVGLARHPGLHVVPALSTRELAREGLRRVAREFDVDHLLSGSVQRLGDQVRISASLVDARSAAQTLAKTLEGGPRDLGGFEAEIVRSVADVLKLAPAPARSSGSTPSDPVAHERYLQARGYMQHFDNEASVDGAIRLLEPLAERDPSNARVWTELARAYRGKYRHTLERSWLERAQAAVARGRVADPASAEALCESGQLHVLLGRQQEAEQELRTAAEWRPDLVEPRLGLTALLMAQGHPAEAEAVCRSAIAIRPDAWNYYNQLGAILFDQGRYEEAIEAFEHVVRLMPDNVRARSNLGAAHFRLGRLDDAANAYRAALDVQRTAAALTGLGTVLFYRDDLPAAVEAFERAAGLRENDPVMWGNLASALRWLPESGARTRAAFDRAIALARGRLELNPRNLDVMGPLATWLASRGDLAEGRECMERALEADPGHAHNLAQAVTIFELCGDRAAALRALEGAVAARYGWMEFENDRDLVRLRASREYHELKSKHPSGTGAGAASPGPSSRPEEDA